MFDNTCIDIVTYYQTIIFKPFCWGTAYPEEDGNTVEASQSSICPDATMEHAGLNNTHTTLCSSKARKTPRRPMSGTTPMPLPHTHLATSLLELWNLK